MSSKGTKSGTRSTKEAKPKGGGGVNTKGGSRSVDAAKSKGGGGVNTRGGSQLICLTNPQFCADLFSGLLLNSYVEEDSVLLDFNYDYYKKACSFEQAFRF